MEKRTQRLEFDDGQIASLVIYVCSLVSLQLVSSVSDAASGPVSCPCLALTLHESVGVYTSAAGAAGRW